MTPNLRINAAAEVGTVILVVEGHRYEFLIIQYIFCRLFKYKMAKHSPRNAEICYAELVLGNNKIIILNTESSNIESLEFAEEYIDRTYSDLVFTHQIDVKNSPLFYIWDRDPGNNSREKMSELLERLTSPYENKKTYEHGMLLVSYPAIESMIISSFEDRRFLPNDYIHVKDYIRDKRYLIESIGEDGLLIATQRMMDGIREILKKEEFGIDFDIGDILKIFLKEEKYYDEKGEYRLLSMFTYVLLWLGIIEIV